MSKKYLIFGATGSIGSNLAEQMYDEKIDCHLIGRNEEELKKIAEKFNYSFSICDVLKIFRPPKDTQVLFPTCFFLAPLDCFLVFFDGFQSPKCPNRQMQTLIQVNVHFRIRYNSRVWTCIHLSYEHADWLK